MTKDIISQILDISDDDCTVTEFHIEGNIKFITIEKNINHNLTCPICGSKLVSKGLFKRHPNNQILQDGYTMDLTVIGRRWKCSNKECSYTNNDKFNFIEDRKRTTKIVDFQILNKLKDINLSCVQVARMFNVSDTYVHQLFMRYIDIPRLKLTRCICIDEVFLNISPTCKYALVIMDFESGEILDIIESRRKDFTERYFLSIPKEERDKVEYLCCDMYDPYVNFTKNYFKNCKVITDSFHVLKWLLNLINIYINDVKKKYQARDRKRLKDNNYLNNLDNKTIKESKEVYILKKAKWVLLKNANNIEYIPLKYNSTLGMEMDTYRWQDRFLELDDNFKIIKHYKDLYEEFNSSFKNDLANAEIKLDELIEIYINSELKIFIDFAKLLTKYHDYIVNSFTYVSSNKHPNNEELRRLSNGPLESFNKIPSALRTSSHGVKNFDFTRNRILWAVRSNPSILAVPKSKEEVFTPGTKRGSYNKK